MIEFAISEIIIECFSNAKDNEFINQKIDRIIIGNSSEIPNMIEIGFDVIANNPNMKPVFYNKDSFVVEYQNVYCWVTYYRNHDGLIDICITGYLNINEIFNQM